MEIAVKMKGEERRMKYKKKRHFKRAFNLCRDDDIDYIKSIYRMLVQIEDSSSHITANHFSVQINALDTLFLFVRHERNDDNFINKQAAVMHK